MDFEDILLSEMLDAKNKCCMITSYETFRHAHRVRKENRGPGLVGGTAQGRSVEWGQSFSFTESPGVNTRGKSHTTT